MASLVVSRFGATAPADLAATIQIEESEDPARQMAGGDKD
jgi:hypothetical protein